MGDEIMDILQGLNEDHTTTIVMVTHDPRMAQRTEKIIRLFDGRQVGLVETTQKQAVAV